MLCDHILEQILKNMHDSSNHSLFDVSGMSVSDLCNTFDVAKSHPSSIEYIIHIPG